MSEQDQPEERPQNVRDISELAQKSASEGNYETACAHYEKLVSLDDSNGKVFTALGHCYLLQGDYQKSFTSYQKALNLLKENGDAQLWYGIGLLYNSFNSYDYAEPAYQAVLQIDPSFEQREEVCYKLGLIYQATGNSTAAIKHFKQALESENITIEKHSTILLHIGSVHEQANEMEEALALYKESLEKKPDNFKAMEFLGWALFQNKEYNEAIGLFQQGLALTKDNFAEAGDLMYLTGRCYFELQNYEEAQASMKRAIHKHPNSHIYWCSIGIVYALNTQAQDAFDCFVKASNLNPECLEVWFNMAVLYEHCVQNQEALLAYQKVISLDPDHQLAKSRQNAIQSENNESTIPEFIHPEIKITEYPFSVKVSECPAKEMAPLPDINNINREERKTGMNLRPRVKRPIIENSEESSSEYESEDEEESSESEMDEEDDDDEEEDEDYQEDDDSWEKSVPLRRFDRKRTTVRTYSPTVKKNKPRNEPKKGFNPASKNIQTKHKATDFKKPRNIPLMPSVHGMNNMPSMPSMPGGNSNLMNSMFPGMPGNMMPPNMNIGMMPNMPPGMMSMPGNLPSGIPSNMLAGMLPNMPSNMPSSMSSRMSSNPSSGMPPNLPMDMPSNMPLNMPSNLPSNISTSMLSQMLSSMPSNMPSNMPSGMSSSMPSGMSSSMPSGMSSGMPSGISSSMPSGMSSNLPSGMSSNLPSGMSSNLPSGMSSNLPSGMPSNLPSGMPSNMPSGISSSMPSGMPSSMSSGMPSSISSGNSSNMPSGVSSNMPSGMPSSMNPSKFPNSSSNNPSGFSSNMFSGMPNSVGMPSMPPGMGGMPGNMSGMPAGMFGMPMNMPGMGNMGFMPFPGQNMPGFPMEGAPFMPPNGSKQPLPFGMPGMMPPWNMQGNPNMMQGGQDSDFVDFKLGKRQHDSSEDQTRKKRPK